MPRRAQTDVDINRTVRIVKADRNWVSLLSEPVWELVFTWRLVITPASAERLDGADGGSSSSEAAADTGRDSAFVV